MKQKDIIKYYEENGGLRCKNWSIDTIREHVKNDLNCKRVLKQTCYELKRSAEIYQR